MQWMTPMQFAPAASLADQLKQFGKTAAPLAKAAGAPAVPPTAGAPLNISPQATNAGTNATPPAGMGIMSLLQGMKPQGILSMLQQMSAGGRAGLPGSAALDGAGMLSPQPPVSASGMPLSLIPGA